MGAVVPHMADDSILRTTLGGAHVYRTGEFAAPRVPGIGWFLVSDTLEENTNEILVQIDLFATSMEQMIVMEGRVRALLHHDTVTTIQGVRMWAQLEGARDNADPEPGFVHRSMDFRFTPARED